MDSEDDICILQSCPPDDEVDAAPHHIVLFDPFSRTSTPDFDRGSHHALQKAYTEVKRRLDESNSKNEQLARKVQELESAKFSSSYIGDSYDMMDDASSSAQGAAGLQHAADAQMAAEEGYHNNLQRQLVRSKAQMQIVEKKYKESVEEMGAKMNVLNQQLQDAQSQVVLVTQEKLNLQRNCEAVRREKEVAQHSLQEMMEKYRSLEIEKDKVTKEGASMHIMLQKANQEVAMLKEKQGDSLGSEPPPELVAELASMRRVIDKLKKMVLRQREYLANRDLSMSMQSSMSRSLRDPSSVESDTSPHASNLGGGGGGSSHSGQSWEMVNGAVPATLDLHQQQQQQQHQQLLMMQQRTVTSTSGGVSPRVDKQEVVTHITVAGKPTVNGSGDAGRSAPVNGQSKPVFVAQKSKTDFIQRRRSEEDTNQPRSKTEMIRSHTGPPSPRLADWMGTHFQQQQQQVLGAGNHTQQPQAGLNQCQQNAAGLNQFQQQPRTGLNELVPGVTSQPRPPHMGIPFPAAPYTQQRQTSPLREPPSTYDNLAFGNQNNNNNKNMPTSFHILNQSGLAGGRIVRNNADSFGSSGGSTMTLAEQQPGLTSPINRDGGIVRGSPQEHIDLTQPRNPTDLELNQYHQIHFVNEPPVGQPSKALDRKCPVCGQDFTHISMDEFQNHVFECFDDAEDTNAPETLQPQQQTCTRKLETGERVCPMCDKSYPENVSQQFFEGHVQSHFEEFADHFEVLNVNRS